MSRRSIRAENRRLRAELALSKSLNRYTQQLPGRSTLSPSLEEPLKKNFKVYIEEYFPRAVVQTLNSRLDNYLKAIQEQRAREEQLPQRKLGRLINQLRGNPVIANTIGALAYAVFMKSMEGVTPYFPLIPEPISNNALGLASLPIAIKAYLWIKRELNFDKQLGQMNPEDALFAELEVRHRIRKSRIETVKDRINEELSSCDCDIEVKNTVVGVFTAILYSARTHASLAERLREQTKKRRAEVLAKTAFELYTMTVLSAAVFSVVQHDLLKAITATSASIVLLRLVSNKQWDQLEEGVLKLAEQGEKLQKKLRKNAGELVAHLLGERKAQ